MLHCTKVVGGVGGMSKIIRDERAGKSRVHISAENKI